MARKKHRKLFPVLATAKNKTLDCLLGICDPICPFNCYEEPDYYTISPSPNTSPSPSISAVYQQSQDRSSSIDAITITSITGAVLFLLLTGFFLVAKYVSESVNRGVNHESNQSERHGEDDDFTVDEDRDDQVDHPIWLIRTTGLQQSIINSITICSYKRGDGLIERTDCPVCLSEFEEDESLRLLPKCNHAFHISCIDTWLSSHTNCPLCRAGIAIAAVTPRCSGPVDLTLGPGGSEERLSSNSDVRVEISETETEEKDRVLGECMDSNGENSIDSLSIAKTHEESVDFSGKPWENRNQDFAGAGNRAIGDEASCSDENISREVKSCMRSFDSCESNGEETGESQWDTSSKKATGSSSSVSSCFKKNKSVVFPL